MAVFGQGFLHEELLAAQQGGGAQLGGGLYGKEVHGTAGSGTGSIIRCRITFYLLFIINTL
jgi:hypothetical protein